MGGRGSCYLNFNDPNGSTMVEGFFDNFSEDEADTLKPYNGKTEKLQNKNIHIKVSTDNFNEEIFIPNIKKVDHLTRKYIDTSNILKETNHDLNIRAGKMPSGVSACFVYNPMNFDILNIVFNQDIKFMDKKRLNSQVQEQIDSGFWMKPKKSEYVNYTLTHEFGHYVQRVLMEKEAKTTQGKQEIDEIKMHILSAKSKKEAELITRKFAEDKATKYFKEIQRIHRKEFGKEDTTLLSRYGQTNNREAFAELFAELNTSNNPNTLSKSMEIFLKKYINTKEPIDKN